MRLAVIGAAGNIGSALVAEALARGHAVIGIVHGPDALAKLDAKVEGRIAEATDADALAMAIAGAEAVVPAVGQGRKGDPTVIAAAARAVVAAMGKAGVRRLVAVGGAGTLEVSPGVQRLDTPAYPAAYRAQGLAQRAAFDTYRASGLDWTYLSPPSHLEPGARTGRYRSGLDTMLLDEHGKPHISIPDYAVALLDEIERPRHVGRRFTVGY